MTLKLVVKAEDFAKAMHEGVKPGGIVPCEFQRWTNEQCFLAGLAVAYATVIIPFMVGFLAWLSWRLPA